MRRRQRTEWRSGGKLVQAGWVADRCLWGLRNTDLVLGSGRTRRRSGKLRPRLEGSWLRAANADSSGNSHIRSVSVSGKKAAGSAGTWETATTEVQMEEDDVLPQGGWPWNRKRMWFQEQESLGPGYLYEECYLIDKTVLSHLNSLYHFLTHFGTH